MPFVPDDEPSGFVPDETAPHEGSLVAPGAKPEPSTLSQIGDAASNLLGLGGPADQQAPQRLMAAQNGATAGAAPIIGAMGETALRTVGHGLAPELIDDTTYADALKKQQRLYGDASATHPVVDVAGSMLIPVPGMQGAGALKAAGKMALASGGQAAVRAYDPQNGWRAKDLPGVAVSTVAGGGAGAAGALLGKLASKGSDLADRAVTRNAEQVAKEAEAANRSAGRALQTETNGAHTVLSNAREAAANPNISPEEAQRTKDFLASEYARLLAEKANWLNLDRGGSMNSAIDRAAAARDEVAAKYTPEGIAALESEKINRPEMTRRAWDLAKKNAPAAIGSGLGYLFGHDIGSAGIGGAIGGVVGSVAGKPGTILRNGIRTPAFQKSLGDAVSLGGDAYAAAAQSPAALRSASGAGPLADYLHLLNDDKDAP